MRLLNTYEFEIDYNAVITPVTPVNDTFVFEDVRENAIIRRSITTPLEFRRSDFDFLKAINDGVDRCDKIPLNVYISGSPRVLLFTCYLNMNEGNWDYSNCKVSIVPTTEDDYTCYDESAQNTKNILLAGTTNKQTATFLIGEIETLVCTCPPGGCTSGDNPLTFEFCGATLANGWNVLEHEATLAITQWAKTTRWVREKVTGGSQPPGDGWISEGSDWVRALPMRLVSEERTDVLYHLIYEVAVTSDGFDNGRTLKDVLEYLGGPCTLSIISDFFTINPDNTYPTNPHYTAARAELNNVLIFQITDIINANATANATIANISLEELLEDLVAMFDLEWWIDGTTLRIEHVSFRQSVQGEDLTGNSRLSASDKFSYKTDDLPKEEIFNWPENTSADFTGVSIEYSANCATIDEKEYTVKKLYSDMAYGLANPTKVNTDLIFILAAADFSGSLVVPFWDNILTGTARPNGNLAWPNLQDDYYKYKRPQLTGTMNEAAETFTTAFRTKVQDPVSIVKSPTAYNSFDVSLTHQTGLGWGEIESANYDAKTCVLTLNLLHE